MFLGFYNYTVVLTYLNALTGFLGIFLLCSGATNNADNVLNYASICILLSGFFDMFDGFVSNLKKQRSIEEKKYGIQIDSLADIISFGILPLLIGYKLLNILLISFEILFFLFILGSCLYLLTVLIRLAYFNVLAEKNFLMKDLKKNPKIYIGLPVTFASIIFPFLILSQKFVLSLGSSDEYFVKKIFFVIYLFFIFLCSFLFIFDEIKFQKPKSITFLIFVFLLFFFLIFGIYSIQNVIK